MEKFHTHVQQVDYTMHSVAFSFLGKGREDERGCTLNGTKNSTKFRRMGHWL